MFTVSQKYSISGLNVLVTGGAGFIGSHLCKELLKQGSIVTVLDDLSTGKLDNLLPDIKFIQGSVNNQSILEELIKETDLIFHLAAIASVPKCEANPELNELVNYQSTNIISSIADKYDVKAFVFSSSAAVYGTPQILPITENHDINPLSLYGHAKANSEDLLIKNYNSPSCSLRLFNIYGKNQDASSPYSGVLSIFLKNTLTGKNISIFGDGKQTRDFTHVSDVVKALIDICKDLLESGTDSICNNKSFNICTGEEINLNQIVKIFESIAKKTILVNHHPARCNDIVHSVGDFNAINEAINWTPKIKLRKGLKKLIQDHNR